jgi:soluble lytic murein transglycosylase
VLLRTIACLVLAGALSSCSGGRGKADADARVDAAPAPVDPMAPITEPPPPPPEDMRAALEAFRGGEFAHAAVLLENLEGKVEVVEDYRLYYLAESLFLSGKHAESMPVYEALGKRRGSRFAPLAPFRKADALLATEQWTEAAQEYASLSSKGIPSTVDSASVHLHWAEAMQRSGRAEAARMRYEHVMRAFPHRPQADQALEALERLEPGYAISTEDRIARAERLMELKRFALAEEELEGLGAGLGKKRAREVALMHASCVYRKRRAWAEAQALYEKLSKGKDDVAAEAAYMVGRCLDKRGQGAKAVAAYRRFLSRFKGSSLRDDALMNVMVLDYEAGRWKQVRGNVKLLRQGVWSGNRRSQALWMIAFASYLDGRLPAALELMDEYEAQATESMSRARAYYWGGVIREAMGRKDAAAQRYVKTAKRYPLHYYALLASRRLEKMERTPPDPAETLGTIERPASQGCQGLPAVVATLLDLGLGYDARQEMRRAHPKLVKAHGDDPAALERIYACAGAQKLLIRHASRWDDVPGKGGTATKWRLLYPTPFVETATEQGKKNGVPTWLAMSIIRQESMFDPDAVSPTRACGLMQLMPATARQVAGEMGAPYDEEALFDAGTNIAFGTHYLGALIRRFPGNLAAAVGAYNGGPHNMARWLRAHAPVDGDVLVELVSYTQTRNYIRRVLTTYARYLYIETGTWRPALEWIPETMSAELGEGPDY